MKNRQIRKIAAVCLLPFMALFHSYVQAALCTPAVAYQVCTVENTATTLTLSDIDPSNSGFSYIRISQPSSGVLSINGNSDVNNVSITPTMLTAGALVWAPANNNAQGDGNPTPTFTVYVYGASSLPPTLTLSLLVAPVNSPPQIGEPVLKNGNFSSGLTDWQVAAQDPGAAQIAYGGIAFNTGQTIPTGVVHQVIATEPGLSYAVTFNTIDGGKVFPGQRVLVSAVDGSVIPTQRPNPDPNNIPLTTVNPDFTPLLLPNTLGYVSAEQDKTAQINFTFTFKAISTQTTIRILDATDQGNGVTIDSDIAVRNISVTNVVLPQSALEGQTIVWSTTKGAPIRVYDIDGPSGIYTLNLSVATGKLILPSNWQASSATLANGTTDNSAGFTLNGTQAQINAAIDGLIYQPQPPLYFNGTDQLSLLLNDNGNTGTCPGASPCPFTASQNIPLTIEPVNNAPEGQPATRTILQGGSYTFQTGDFVFSDPNDTPYSAGGNNFQAVVITSPPAAGSLMLNGSPLQAGAIVPIAQLSSMVWTPPATASGVPYTTFTFQVQDDGGTANGGVDTDTTPRTFTFNVNRVNMAPTGTPANVTIQQGGTYSFNSGAFGFTDTDADSLNAVIVTTLPGAGTLALNGTAVTTGQSITAGQISQLTWTPETIASGTPYTSFTFQVQDNGGTAFGGHDTDPAPKAFVFNVTKNEPPVAADDAYTVAKNSKATALSLLANDTDAEGDTLSLKTIGGTVITPGVAQTIAVTNGTVNVSVSGDVSFTPSTDYVGTVAFSYSVTDKFNISNNAQVTITVAAQIAATPVPVGNPWFIAAMLLVMGLIGGLRLNKR